MTPRRQDGALLLVVSLLLATIAALAFGMNRAASMESRSVMDDYDGRAAAYLADAGIAAAKWRTQVTGCPKNKVSNNVELTRLGNGSFKADAVGDASKLTIAATGAVAGTAAGNDALRSAARSRLQTFDFTDPETEDDDNPTMDTTIALLRATPEKDPVKLSLISAQSHALIDWAVDDIDKDDRVISATLTLTLLPASRSTGARTVALHRMTTRWDANATWTESRSKVLWTGNDYSSTARMATVAAGASTVSWDVTSLVEAWIASPAANLGLLLRLTEPNQAIDFYNRKASSNQRPMLRVIVAEKC